MQLFHAGCVKVNGQDVRKVSQKSLRAAIGMVPQELSLGFWEFRIYSGNFNHFQDKLKLLRSDFSKSCVGRMWFFSTPPSLTIWNMETWTRLAAVSWLWNPQSFVVWAFWRLFGGKTSGWKFPCDICDHQWPSMEKATEKDIQKAAVDAQLDGFIDQQAKGYDAWRPKQPTSPAECWNIPRRCWKNLGDDCWWTWPEIEWRRKTKARFWKYGLKSVQFLHKRHSFVICRTT